MRITEQMSHGSTLEAIQRGKSRTDRLIEQITTQRKISDIGEDPLLAQKSLAFGAALDKLEHYDRTHDRMEMWYTAADSSLLSLHDFLVEIHEHVVSAIGTRLHDPAAVGEAAFFEGMKEQLANLANTQVNGQYIFAGFQTDTRPFDADGTFHGDSNTIMVEAAQGVQMELNLNGQELFSDVGYSGENMFQMLQDTADAINANDQGALTDVLDKFNAAIDVVSQSTVELGGMFDRLRITSELRDSLEVNTADMENNWIGTDMAEAITELRLEETALQAALQATNSTIQPTLLNFLR